eukprot:214892_1
MPNVGEFFTPLLFEQCSTLIQDCSTAPLNKPSVVNKTFYQHIMIPVRNMWMAYSINREATQQRNKKFFIVIGSKHGATDITTAGQKYPFMATYSLQNLLIKNNVPLPFTLD